MTTDTPLRDMTLRQIESSYLDSVRGIADEAADIADEDERDAYIHESVDSSEWVIYTYRARLVSVVSDYASAWEDEYPGEEYKPEVVAFWAMRADVLYETDRIIANREDADEDE